MTRPGWRARHSEPMTAARAAQEAACACKRAGLVEHRRRIGFIVEPPGEQCPGAIDRQAVRDEPGRPKLRLVGEHRGRPLGSRPDAQAMIANTTRICPIRSLVGVIEGFPRGRPKRRRWTHSWASAASGNRTRSTHQRLIRRISCRGPARNQSYSEGLDRDRARGCGCAQSVTG